MKRLIVHLNGEQVGTLDQNDDGLIEFRYKAEWLNRPDAVPLSRSLPLQGDSFRGKHARSFFAGMLPDEGPRRQIASILGVSERNDFALLERIGGECAGAVGLWPEGFTPLASGHGPSRELNEQEMADIIRELPRRPLLAGREGIRLSLAGAQSKLPIIMHGMRVALPLGDTPSTHIIKPEPERFPGLAANEVFCMALARTVGLDTPPVHILTIGGTPCIVVERYDRACGPDGTIQRVHQEDFCQALGIPPEQKYQQEGGPLLRDCMALLREWSTVPALDVRSFVDGLIFNMLIGNADAHGKNFSFLYKAGERKLAPFYDLVCTLVWPELSKVPAMKIGGSESIENITPSNWRKMARECRIGWPMMRERIVSLCDKAIVGCRNPEIQEIIGHSDMAQRVARLIESRAKFLSVHPDVR